MLPSCHSVRTHHAHLALTCWLAVWCACAPTTASDQPAPETPRYPLIPYPRSLEPRPGAFVFDTATRIVLPPESDPRIAAMTERWANRVRQASGLPLPVTTGDSIARTDAAGADRMGSTAGGDIVLRLDPAASDATDEGYRLSVTPAGVTLSAPAPAGLFYGLQTLRQLLPPAVEVADAGMTIDAPIDRGGVAVRRGGVSAEDAAPVEAHGVTRSAGTDAAPAAPHPPPPSPSPPSTSRTPRASPTAACTWMSGATSSRSRSSRSTST